MTIAIAVLIVGLIIWIATEHPKISEAGRIMFAFGLLATLLAIGSGSVIK